MRAVRFVDQERLPQLPRAIQFLSRKVPSHVIRSMGTDDLPPTTVITHMRQADKGMVVRGTTADNGTIKRVLVNGKEARALAPNFAEWEASFEKSPDTLSAFAEDMAGNVEQRPNVIR